MVEKAHLIIRKLKKSYGSPKPFLVFHTPYQLLVAVILSAQCTDVMVNRVTKKLFEDCPGPKDIVSLGVDRLIPYIRSCGYYNSKAKHIVAATRMILAHFEGKVPKDFEQLQSLPGVGEKTAGVILTQVFHIPAFPVDTHIFRVARRLGLSKQNDPNKVSRDLQKIFPKKSWEVLTKQIIVHGRTLCTARNPKCPTCPLLRVCPEGQKRTQ